MQKKKQSISPLQKKLRDSSGYIHNEKVGKWFINYYYLTVKVKKNVTYTLLMSNHMSDAAYEA